MKARDRNDIWSAICRLEDAGRWIKADAKAGDHKADDFAKEVDRIAKRAKLAFERIPKD